MARPQSAPGRGCLWYATCFAQRRVQMVLIQLLLPTGAGDTAAWIDQTRRELVERYDGVTAYLRSPAAGLWTAPDGRTESDDVVMVEVVAETFDRTWWRGYARSLAKRFRQREIHVRAWPVDMPDKL